MEEEKTPWYKTSAWVPIGIFGFLISYALFSCGSAYIMNKTLIQNALKGNRSAIHIMKHQGDWYKNDELMKAAIEGNEYAKEIIGIKEK